RHVEYTFFSHVDEQGNTSRYINQVISSDRPQINYDYTRMKDSFLVSQVRMPDGRYLEMEYDKEGRVITQKAPIGTNGEKRTIFRFEYRPKEHHTIVHDAHDRKSVFRYSWKKRLTM